MHAVDEVFINLNRSYMAVIVVSSMVVVMVAVMRTMLVNHKANARSLESP